MARRKVSLFIVMMLGTFAGVVLVTACGGIAHRDREHADGTDAAADADAGFDTARFTPCVARRRVEDDAGPLVCHTHADCTGAETCQSGVCCAGEVVGGVCHCGGGDGCTAGKICCLPTGATGTTSATCVSQLGQCAQK